MDKYFYMRVPGPGRYEMMRELSTDVKVVDIDSNLFNSGREELIFNMRHDDAFLVEDPDYVQKARIIPLDKRV